MEIFQMNGVGTATILIFGHDQVLLATRQRVLQEIGIPVATATTTFEFCAILSAERPALILFCQSLSSEECSGAELFVRRISPNSKILLMYNRPGKCQLNEEHAEFFCLEGPAALIDTVKRMIPDAIEDGDHSPRGMQQS